MSNERHGIKPMEPEGLKQSPMRPAEEVKPEKVQVVEPIPAPMDDKVGWMTLILNWIKVNMSGDILNYLEGKTMNSKAWYASKTIWVNLIAFIWTIVGPMIGIPTLPAELMFCLVLGVNLLLRLITKRPIILLDELSDGKPWYLSKTIIVNIITGVWFFVGPIVGIPTLTPDMMTHILDVLNVVLRFFTKEPLTATAKA